MALAGTWIREHHQNARSALALHRAVELLQDLDPPGKDPMARLMINP